MVKKAITYYYDMMRNSPMTNIEFHNSGTEAVDYLVENCGRYFSPKPIWKKTEPNRNKRSYGRISASEDGC